ncbi:MAG: STAS domain-containing protein [Acidimicrobiales bacterium]
MSSTADAGPVLTVRVEPRADGGRTLRVEGEIDLATAPQLEQAMADASAGVTCVGVDLAGVRFIDSTGLRVLLASQQTAQAAGVEVCVTDASEVARRLFELTGTSARLMGS